MTLQGVLVGISKGSTQIDIDLRNVIPKDIFYVRHNFLCNISYDDVSNLRTLLYAMAHILHIGRLEYESGCLKTFYIPSEVNTFFLNKIHFQN